MKKRLFLSYAWSDNKEQDIDYVFQQLEATGKLDVVFDRRELIAGQRLWEQIADAISDPKTDAYCIVVTPGSLSSPACREELAYALDRALDKRGEGFPIIPLLHRVDFAMLPPALRVRLGVGLANQGWTQLVVDAAFRRSSAVSLSGLGPWKFRVYRYDSQPQFTLEVTPRIERYPRWAFGFPANEKNSIFRGFSVRPPGVPQGGSVMTNVIESENEFNFRDGRTGQMFLFGCDGGTPLSHEAALMIGLNALPSILLFSDDWKNFVDVELGAVRLQVPTVK